MIFLQGGIVFSQGRLNTRFSFKRLFLLKIIGKKNRISHMRRYYILTMGCQMNKNDSERIDGLLASLGYQKNIEPDDCDLLIINTCSVRQAAEDRVCGIVRNWQNFRSKNPDVVIAITGCMPGRDNKGQLRRKIPGVDLWFGIDELPHLPVWLKEVATGKEEGLDYLNINPLRDSREQASITIQTGCNNFCSYCVVPNARGRERNRPVKDILNEVRDFALNGGLEITLLGQVVNHYIAPDPDNFSKKNPFLADHFAALLWELNQIKKIKRIHFMAPDPQYINQVQINALKLPKQMNYIHLPAQSGDNEILKKMNRKYTREKYLEIIKNIRHTCPSIAIGTDLIVGFCGETDGQFQNTLNLYRECDFDIAYTAMYSQRSGTVAAKAFKNDVSRFIKKKRWEDLQELMEKRVMIKNQKYVGQTVEVLVEKYEEGVCSGNSKEMKLVQFLGTADLVGTIVNVKIFEAKEWLLKGERI